MTCLKETSSLNNKELFHQTMIMEDDPLIKRVNFEVKEVEITFEIDMLASEKVQIWFQ